MPPSGFCLTAIPTWPGILMVPMAGSAPIYLSWSRSRSRGRANWMRSSGGARRLLDFLLDGPAKRKQPLIERGRHVADEFDDAAAVFEDSRLPDQLIAEFVDLGLVGWCRILQRLQGERIAANLVRGLALFARHPLEPGHDRRKLGIESLKQPDKQ